VSDQSAPASWVPAAWMAVVFGAIALLLGGLSAGQAGVGVVLVQLPMVVAILVCGLASVLVVVLMWAKPPVWGTWLSRALVVVLSLEWLGIAAFGAFGPSAGVSYGRSGKVLTVGGSAVALLVIVTIGFRVLGAESRTGRR